jgi:hypothetical protein
VTEPELYDIYSRWTGELHFFTVRDLGQHVDCEYFPAASEFKVYSGYALDSSFSGTVPSLGRPLGERSETIKLLKPEDNPSRSDLDALFKMICLAAARVLRIKPKRPGLTTGRRDPEDGPALRGHPDGPGAAG